MATRKFRMVSAQESGVGGYLLLFVISQFVSIGFAVWYIAGTIAEFSTPATAADPAAIPVLAILVILHSTQGLVYIIGLVLIFRRDRRSRTYYLWALGVLGVIFTLEALALRTVTSVRPVVYCLVWFLYWRASERVRLTFTPNSGMTEIPKTS